MLDEPGNELIQIQNDRFIRNWRRYHDRQLVYPEYLEHLRPQLISDFAAFIEFLRVENLGEPEFDQCEVTYVNHIERDGLWSSHGDLHQVFRGWSSAYPSVRGQSPETIAVRVRHEIHDDKDSFAGRLYVDIDSGLLPADRAENSEPRPVFVLQLVARGHPFGAGLDGALGFLDLGHDTIVRAFDTITTDAAHSEWRKLS
jgi:uncharacterized protein (TIGR04255 family)